MTDFLTVFLDFVLCIMGPVMESKDSVQLTEIFKEWNPHACKVCPYLGRGPTKMTPFACIFFQTGEALSDCLGRFNVSKFFPGATMKHATRRERYYALGKAKQFHSPNRVWSKYDTTVEQLQFCDPLPPPMPVPLYIIVDEPARLEDWNCLAPPPSDDIDAVVVPAPFPFLYLQYPKTCQGIRFSSGKYFASRGDLHLPPPIWKFLDDTFGYHAFYEVHLCPCCLVWLPMGVTAGPKANEDPNLHFSLRLWDNGSWTQVWHRNSKSLFSWCNACRLKQQQQQLKTVLPLALPNDPELQMLKALIPTLKDLLILVFKQFIQIPELLALRPGHTHEDVLPLVDTHRMVTCCDRGYQMMRCVCRSWCIQLPLLLWDQRLFLKTGERVLKLTTYSQFLVENQLSFFDE